MIYALGFCTVGLLFMGVTDHFGSDLSICRIGFGVYVFGDIVRRMNEKAAEK